MTKNNTNSQSNVNNTQTSKIATKPIAIKLTNTADGWKTTQQNKRLLSIVHQTHNLTPPPLPKLTKANYSKPLSVMKCSPKMKIKIIQMILVIMIYQNMMLNSWLNHLLLFI